MSDEFVLPPGRPADIRSTAALLGAVGDEVQHLTRMVAAIDEGVDAKVWRGSAADGFHRLLANTVPVMTSLAEAHRLARQTLDAFAGELDTAQRAAVAVKADIDQARADRDSAFRQVAKGTEEARAQAGRADLADARSREAEAMRGSSPDPGYQAYLDAYQAEAHEQAADARAAHAEVRGRVVVAEAAMHQSDVVIDAAAARGHDITLTVETAARRAADALAPRAALTAGVGEAAVLAIGVGAAKAVGRVASRGDDPWSARMGPRSSGSTTVAEDGKSFVSKYEVELASADAKGTTTVGGALATGEASAALRAQAEASGGITSTSAGVAAAASVGAVAQANGSITKGIASASGTATASAGAEAEVDAKIGLDGAHLHAGGFVGGKVAVEGGGDVGGLGLAGKAEGWAGVGFELDPHIEKGEDGKYHIGAGLGAAVGLGGKLEAGVTVDPGKIADTLSDASDAIGHGADAIRGAGSSFGKKVLSVF